tara:strand:- start:1154 stop:2077 length:924 start_codon:yes stop_codon:yes gene_type:complete
MESITLRAPATIANLSCGFDVLGLCIKNPFDEIKITKNNDCNVVISIQDSPFSDIPDNPNQNTGGIPAQLIIDHYNLDFGFNIDIKKGIPLCGGLGSSAATAAGVVYGINEILDKKLSFSNMIKYALEGEKLSSDSPHADNIGPCIAGGLVLIRDTKSLDLINIPIDNYYFAIIHPDILIDTKSARKILPKKIDLDSAIKQWGNVASLTYGFSSKNIDLIKKSMKDYIIEPVRSKLIPAYDNIKNTALDNGAIGCSISGSGPSVFALCEDRKKAEKILISMEKVLLDNSIKYHSYVTSVNNQGIEIL